jgi:hypothetical protein
MTACVLEKDSTISLAKDNLMLSLGNSCTLHIG